MTHSHHIGIDRITPSGLMLYKKCPMHFYYEVWLGIKLPQQTMHFAFGTAIHLAIDNIYEQMDATSFWDLAEVSIAKKQFTNNFKLEHVDSFNWKGEPISEEERLEIFNDMLADGLAIVTEYWNAKEELFTKGVQPDKFEIAHKYIPKHLVSETPWEIPLSLRIDAQSSNKRIHEFKTSSKRYDETETRHSLQALSYAFTQYQQTGEIVPLDYVVMLKKLKKNKLQHFTIEYDYQDLLAYQAEVDSIFERIKNREFSRPAKGHDMFCDCYKFEKLFDDSI